MSQLTSLTFATVVAKSLCCVLLFFYYYYYQFFQRWVTQKAILPVQGDPQHRTYIHMYNYTQTNTKGT